jgi:hypothetical protein
MNNKKFREAEDCIFVSSEEPIFGKQEDQAVEMGFPVKGEVLPCRTGMAIDFPHLYSTYGRAE